MKKINIFAAILSLALSLAAQDTIHTHNLKSSYYSSIWVPLDTCGEILFREQHHTVDEEAWSMVVKDTIYVYGIAAGVDTGMFITPFDLDTTLDSIMCRIHLMERRGSDLVPISEDVIIHVFHTPIEYYWDLDWAYNCGFYPPTYRPPIPMYERYFDTAVAIGEDFYIGWSDLGGRPVFIDINGHEYMRFNRRHSCLYTISNYNNHPDMTYCIHTNFSNDDSLDYNPDSYTWGFEEGIFAHDVDIPLVFPILTPQPDTTSNDTTLSAGEPDMLRRYTAVTPNPVTGRAKVVSSFGLTMVEAFNAAGEKVHELRLPDTPLTATLDVSRWPTGTYILRLHTPQGVATKKLIVK